MNVYLIGMPGCGKSTIGKKLKKLIGYNYVDLDNYIEKLAGKTIPEIFSSEGEAKFRELEQKALLDFKNEDSYVISCGGGIISNLENKNLMNGKVVFIDVSIKELEKRVAIKGADARPMFKTKTVKELYDERIDKYNYFKDITVKNRNIKRCLADIVNAIGIKLKKVLVINGPNLNMLGKRPKEHYGSLTLDEINSLIKKEADYKLQLEFYQSNYEGDLVTKIQEAVLKEYDAIVINPAAYTHTSVAIHDALEMFNGIKCEVHLSKVDEREGFRRINYVREVCDCCFAGMFEQSYVEAIKYLKNKLNVL